MVVAIGTISLSGDPAIITIVDTSVHDCALQYININTVYVIIFIVEAPTKTLLHEETTRY
jgi:hypothetical protein